MPSSKKHLDHWSAQADNTLSNLKRFLAHLSIQVRSEQLDFFLKKLKPSKNSTVLDVGVSPEEELVDTNHFEKNYPYKKQLHAASVEKCPGFAKKYKIKAFTQVRADKPYPFLNKQFDIVVAWATLEHVGGEKQQRYFLKELDRVGKKVFVTTPYKCCFYEPHTELVFLHWLPDKFLRRFLKYMGKEFWANEANWRSLGRNDLKKILPSKKYKVQLYKMFGLIPSHLLIYKA